MTDYESVVAALQDGDGRWQAVFHAAGVVAYSSKMGPLMEEVNVNGTSNVVNAMEKVRSPENRHDGEAWTSKGGRGPLLFFFSWWIRLCSSLNLMFCVFACGIFALSLVFFFCLSWVWTVDS